jgi:hypothetical protein
MYASLNPATAKRVLAMADLAIPDPDSNADALHAAEIPTSAAPIELTPGRSSLSTPISSTNSQWVRDAFFAPLGNPASTQAWGPAAQFADVIVDLVFANPTGDFGRSLPAPERTALRPSSIFAAGSTSASDGSFGIVSIFRDSLGQGSEDQLVPMASPWVQPDTGLDIIPQMEKW